MIVAIDGSPHSDTTLAFGLREAEIRGAVVLLVRAWTNSGERPPPWSRRPAAPRGADHVRFDTEA
ncbi:hypothetical protein [Puerhibacterium sp. TATVAM-FAB25]|uniref:hypothetical protein n=1 Tax=Puerhibacterium sp. TATVAM-FAB25 TaxID=3093699 RepID=UPI00397C4927